MLAALTLLLTLPDEADAKRDAIVAQCGIPTERVVVVPSPASDAPEIHILGSGPLTDKQFDCIGDVFNTGEMMVPFAFEDAALSKRYTVLAGRANLAASGMLDRLPVRGPREALPAFARRLEAFCKAPAGSLLVAEGENIRVRDAAFVRMSNEPEAGSPFVDQVLCAVNAIGASGFNAFSSELQAPMPMVEVIKPES